MKEEPRSRPPRGSGAASQEERATVRGTFDLLLHSPGYERLRESLTRLFARRGSEAPDELADETIARVISKLPEISRDYDGRPERYVYAVARNVFREYARRPQAVPYDDAIAVATDDDPELENAHHCLERCIDTLPESERELIQGYYLHERSVKIDHRRDLAERLGLGLNALRIKAFRVRKRLYRCVTKCLESSDSGETKRR